MYYVVRIMWKLYFAGIVLKTYFGPTLFLAKTHPNSMSSYRYPICNMDDIFFSWDQLKKICRKMTRSQYLHYV